MKERRVIMVKNTEVAFTSTEDAPLLFLVRMASRRSGIWDGIWDRLGEKFTVANFELELNEKTALDDPRALFSCHADMAAMVADHLGYCGFHMIGWNGGAHIGLFTAFRYPRRLQSCILLGPFRELPDMRSVEKGLEFMRVMMSQPDRKLYAYYWYMMGLSGLYIDTRFDSIESMASRRAENDRFIHLNIQRKMEWARALRKNWLSETELASIRVPVLLIATGLDKWGAGPNVAMAKELQRLLPGSELEVISDHGSLTLVEDPEPFLSIVSRFYDRTASYRKV